MNREEVIDVLNIYFWCLDTETWYLNSKENLVNDLLALKSRPSSRKAEPTEKDRSELQNRFEKEKGIKMKKQSLSYVELSEVGCDCIVLRNLRIREEVYSGASAPLLASKDSKTLAKSIIKLFQSVAVKKKTLFKDYKEWKEMDYEMSMAMRGSASEHNYIVPIEFVLAFVSMYDSMAGGTKNIYAIGLDKGKNLLIGLNDGTYTINDFNKSKNKE